MLIGEVPDPDRDPDGWAAYVQAAQDRAAALDDELGRDDA
jgi:hypothetical protein